MTLSMDDNAVISGDVAAIQAANENKDGDILFGLNEVRWSQVINGTYENLKVADWTPSWAEEVGQYKYDGKAYGLVMGATFQSSYGKTYAMVIQNMCAEEGRDGYNVNATGRRNASTVFIMAVSGLILYLVYGVGARDLGERLQAKEKRRRMYQKLVARVRPHREKPRYHMTT